LDKVSKNQELREMFVQAFADARAGGKPDWRNMNLSVLKNRLLQRSERRFQETDYGGKTIKELVERFPDLLKIDEDNNHSVSILIELGDNELAKDEDQITEIDENGGEFDEEAERFQAILDKYRTSGDNLGVGEAYALQLTSAKGGDIEKIFVNIITQWASSNPFDAEIDSIKDLLEHIDKFVIDSLALAVVHATLRVTDARQKLPARVGDLNYRVADSLKSLFALRAKTSPAAVMASATAKTKEMNSALEKAVERFCESTTVAAKLPSTDIIKHAHAYAPYALLGERQTLRDVEVLLGTLFRKFCESCEKYEAEQIPRRAKDLTGC